MCRFLLGNVVRGAIVVPLCPWARRQNKLRKFRMQGRMNIHGTSGVERRRGRGERSREKKALPLKYFCAGLVFFTSSSFPPPDTPSSLFRLMMMMMIETSTIERTATYIFHSVRSGILDPLKTQKAESFSRRRQRGPDNN